MTPADVGDLTPLDVIEVYDGSPCLFTTRVAGALYLAYVADAGDVEALRLVPTTEAMLADLDACRLPLRDALTRAGAWIVRRTWEGEVLSVTPADTDPAGSYLPLPGVMLWLTPSPPVTLDYDERAGVLYVRHEGTTLAKTLPSVDDLTWMHVDADGYVIGLTIEAADKMTEAQWDEHPEAGDIPLAMRLAVRAWLTRPDPSAG